MGAIRYVKARRRVGTAARYRRPHIQPTSKLHKKKLLKLNTSFFELRLPLLCVVIVFSLAGVFKLPVFFILDPIGVEFAPPSGPFDPQKP